MDQISLTELRRFYFGPTLAESILYGYGCLQEFFGWNDSAKKKNVEPGVSSNLQQLESIEASDENLTNLKIKTEHEDLGEKFEPTLSESNGKEFVVASMSNDPRKSHHSNRHSKVSDIIAEIIKDDPKRHSKSPETSNTSQSSENSPKPEVKPENKRPLNETRKPSIIIVEGISTANKNDQKFSDQSSVEQKFGQSATHSAKTDCIPMKSSRELRRTLNGLRKKSEILVKGSDPARKNSFIKLEMPSTSLKSNKRASDTSTSEFISFESSGERKRSLKELRKLSSTSFSKDLTTKNSKINSVHTGSIHRKSLVDNKETTLQRPVTSSISETRQSPSSPSPQRRHSSSSRPHQPTYHDPKAPSAHQSRNRPRLTATRWAIARVNEFDDGAKTYEILPDATKLLPGDGDLGRTALNVLRQMQKLQKSQPVPELTTTEVIFATLPGGHTISYNSNAAKSR